VYLLGGAVAASATQIKVAILSGLSTQAFNDDVVAKIQPNAPFLNIDVLPVYNSTPTLGILDQYQAVMVIGSLPFQDATTLGTNLRAYMDQGQAHGVVITATTNTSGSCASGTQLCGTFNTGNYWAINPGTMIVDYHATLGTVYQPNNPVMQGVTSFDGGSISQRISGSVNAAATKVASWSDGTPLVATRTFSGGVMEIALNFMPVSSDAYTGNWLSSTNGGLLLANAFNVVAGASGLEDETPEPSAYLITASGLGLLALLLRRRPGTIKCESAERPRHR
jgi:hypothetical protein